LVLRLPIIFNPSHSLRRRETVILALEGSIEKGVPTASILIHHGDEVR
jgi:hypothetical protein